MKASSWKLILTRSKKFSTIQRRSSDLRLVTGLFDQSEVEGGAGVFEEFDSFAGQDPVVVLIRLRQEHVFIANAEAGDPVLEAAVILVEGDHDGHELI